MRRWAQAGVLSGLLIATGALGLWWKSQGPPPNIVLILGCTLRRDQLTPYGAPPNVSPFVAEVRAEGTLFTDVIASSSWTKESSTALLTGHPASTVGMTEPLRRHSTRVLPQQLTTLAEQLSSHGYGTVGVTANPHLNSTYGFDQGFDHYEDTSSRGFSLQNKIPGREVVARGLALLDQRDPKTTRPFYMQLVLIDPHQPSKVSPKRVSPFQGPGISERLASYRANVRQVDNALRSLDEGLRARGYTPENTIFVLVADHGEGLNLPEHHRQQHGRVLYPSLTSVPWILRGPGVQEGHTVTGLASHVDVMPTLLDLAGIEPEGGEGTSWATAASGWRGQTSRQQAFTETWYFGANRAAIVTPETACQRDWGTVGIPDDTFVQGCFHRDTDPDWITPHTDAPLLAELQAWRDRTQRAYDRFGAADDADDAVGTREQLKALGYVED
jgi:arylsulfatase A-like enzyme